MIGTVIKINGDSYSEEEIVNNWAAEYAKRKIAEHKDATIIDHPDGSITQEKLSESIRNALEKIPERVSELENDKGYISDHQNISHKADISYVESAVAVEKTERKAAVTEMKAESAALAQRIAAAEDNVSAASAAIDIHSDEIAEISAGMGDIDTALDSIIAIQNKLIGA